MNDCGCGELSEDNNVHWGLLYGNRSPAHSPPIEEVASSVATPPEEGVDVDLDQVRSDEPVVRKRRVSKGYGWLLANEAPPPWPEVDGAFDPQSSGKTAFRCLWPSCGKMLTSVVGIRRHIRTNHLR